MFLSLNYDVLFEDYDDFENYVSSTHLENFYLDDNLQALDYGLNWAGTRQGHSFWSSIYEDGSACPHYEEGRRIIGEFLGFVNTVNLEDLWE